MSIAEVRGVRSVVRRRQRACILCRYEICCPDRVRKKILRTKLNFDQGSKVVILNLQPSVGLYIHISMA